MSADKFKHNITIYLMEHKFGKIDSEETLQAIFYEAEAYHKAELEKVSEENIEERSCIWAKNINEYGSTKKSFKAGVKWVLWELKRYE